MSYKALLKCYEEIVFSSDSRINQCNRLVACNGDDDSDGLEAPVEDPEKGPGDPTEAGDEEGGIGETADESDLITESDFDDQTVLGIGHTAQVQTNLDAFEITLHAVSSEAEISDEAAELGHLLRMLPLRIFMMM